MSDSATSSEVQKRNRPSFKRVETDDPPPQTTGRETYVNISGVTCNDSRHENVLGREKGSSYENVSSMGKDGRPLTSHHSEPTINTPEGKENNYDEVVLRLKKPRAETSNVLESSSAAKAKLLLPNITECSRCEELEQLLALWELGVSGFARNYSMILAQLNKVREASMCLESRMKQRAGTESLSQTSFSASSPQTSRVRHSMLENGVEFGTREPKLVDQMYPPNGSSHDNTRDLPPEYAKCLMELNTHLGSAIDLCQKLAAACFKKSQTSVLKSQASSAKKKPVSRLVSQPDPPKSITPPATPFRPSLVSISENKLSRTLERQKASQKDTVSTPTTPGFPPSNGWADSDSNSESEEEEREGENMRHSRRRVEVTSLSPSTDSKDSSPTGSQELRESQRRKGVGKSRSNSILSHVSSFSDDDVKQVMSKIAGLEEERMKLLETIDKLHLDNQHVRQSLYETLGDLENKDLQLMLAMQDLTIATDEIKRAAAMRQALQTLESEKDALLNRLSNLEDESAAVKVSLIQLLQQKSATNKTLALENLRLSQKMKHLSSSSLPQRASSTSQPGDGDNVSMASNVTAEDATMQEAFMGLEDAGCFVHKQGFLVKQGGKVKSWKRRLFVLDSDGLSYFKTEQPIQSIPLSRIEAVQVSHGRTPYPNMFQVHTRDRVFLLSAPTDEEMQSWVGMLQTLKQYDKQRNFTRRNCPTSLQNSPLGPPSDPQSPTRRRVASDTDSERKSAQVKDNTTAGAKEEGEATGVLNGRLSKSVPSRSFMDEEDITVGSLDLAHLQKPL